MINKFTEEDLKKATRLMSLLSTQAEFKSNLNGFIDIYNLFDWAKKELLPKIEANILEVKKITQTNKKKDT